MNGFLRLSRGLFSHWLWDEDRVYSRAEAWLDLVQMAAWSPTKRVVRDQLLELVPGELVASTRFLGERWGWGKDKVGAFLKMLESDGMIRRETRHRESVVILCNYEAYNTVGSVVPANDPTVSRHGSDGEPTPPRQSPDTAPPNIKSRKNEKSREEQEERKTTGAQSSGDDLSWDMTAGWLHLKEEDLAKWAELFPACDIPRQIALADEWLRANPAKSHKKRWRRFLVNWLTRAQERGGDLPSRAAVAVAASVPGSDAPAAPAVVPREPWKIEADLKRIESQLVEVRRDEARHQFVTEDGVSRKVLRPEAREEVRRLKERRDALKRELLQAA